MLQKIIENLEKLVLLEELWLGKNKIRGLEVRLLFRVLCVSVNLTKPPGDVIS